MFSPSTSGTARPAGAVPPAPPAVLATPLRRSPAEANTAAAARNEFDGALAVGLASKIGPRTQNDDFAGFGRSREIFAVADGIGGAPRGDVAATVAVNAAIEAFEKGDSLANALISANAAVMQTCEWLDSPETGSTLLLAARDDSDRGRIDFAWAGDSTAFLLHDGALSLITEPDRHPGGNALTSAVGYLPDPTPRTTSSRIEQGDRFLMCTDGVWETLDPARLAELLSEGDNAPWIAETIAREAAGQGSDNATALVLIAQKAESGPRFDLDEAGARGTFIARAPRAPRTPSYPESDYRDDSRPPLKIDEIVSWYGLALKDDLATFDQIDVE